MKLVRSQEDAWPPVAEAKRIWAHHPQVVLCFANEGPELVRRLHPYGCPFALYPFFQKRVVRRVIGQQLRYSADLIDSVVRRRDFCDR